METGRCQAAAGRDSGTHITLASRQLTAKVGKQNLDGGALHVHEGRPQRKKMDKTVLKSDVGVSYKIRKP